MLPLSEFVGWNQLGIAMVQKGGLPQNPGLKGRDSRKGNIIAEVPVSSFSSSTLNIVIELVHHKQLRLLDDLGLGPPGSAIQFSLPLGNIKAVLTVLGEDSDLLVTISNSGFKL